MNEYFLYKTAKYQNHIYVDSDNIPITGLISLTKEYVYLYFLCLNGKLHNLEGPAFAEVRQNKNIFLEYHIYGEYIGNSTVYGFNFEYEKNKKLKEITFK
jgi:hypothetical protein